MNDLTGVPWDYCIRALRRAGFFIVAESPSVAMLVGGAGVSVTLRRAPVVDEEMLVAAFHPRRPSRDTVLELLGESPRAGTNDPVRAATPS